MTDSRKKEDPLDREVCVCFRVPMRKIVKHVRLNHPRVASQLSECFGAGTGCGWCVPFLEKIFEQMREDPSSTPEIGISREEYLARRRAYHRKIAADRMEDKREGEGIE